MGKDPTISTALSRRRLSILGYGLARSFSERPFFKTKEYLSELEQNGLHVPQITTTISHVRSMSDANLFQARLSERVQPESGRPASEYKITNLGRVTLVENLDDQIRNHAAVLPDLLELPSSVEAVLNRMGYLDHLMEQILGVEKPTCLEDEDGQLFFA